MDRKARIILIIVAACIVTGGAAFGVVVATTWGEYEYSDSYYYTPAAPLTVEKINLDTDIGQINIKYNTTPTDYYIQVDLAIKIVGGFVAGTSFSDFFYPIQWLNTSSPVTFELDAKANPAFIFGLTHWITIDLTLRTDIVYDIDAFSSVGSIDMNVPENIIINDASLDTSTGSIALNSAHNVTFQGNLGISTSTGSIRLYAKQNNFTNGLTTSTSTGSLTLNFSQCIIGDDLIGTVSTGSITLRSYNMRYTTDANWNVNTDTGSIDVQILQYIEMNANITGTIGSSTGSIDIVYDDSMSSIGAQFACSTSTGSVSYVPLGSGGMNILAGLISSGDYSTATNKYTFVVSTSTGSVEVLGRSL